MPFQRASRRCQKSGRFLLTGSARLSAMPQLADALVGRADLLELLPLSMRERTGQEGSAIDLMFDDPQSLTRPIIESFDESLVTTGGFPESIARGGGSASATWHRSYAATVCRRAVNELGGSSPEALERTLRSLAARSSGILNIDGLARDLGSPPTTLRRQLEVLDSAYMVNLTPAWVTNAASRVRKAPKIHVIDSGSSSRSATRRGSSMTVATASTFQVSGPPSPSLSPLMPPAWAQRSRRNRRTRVISPSRSGPTAPRRAMNLRSETDLMSSHLA